MSSQFVTLARHAKSSWKTENQADFDRPLNERGARDGHTMARRLLNRQCIPDLLLCSSARRAQETAAFLYTELKLSEEQFELHDELYLASAGTLLDILSTVPVTVNHVMVVAHNPGLEALSDLLAGRTLPPLPTLGIRQFAVSSIRELGSYKNNAAHSDTHKADPVSPAKLVFEDYPKADRGDL
ncbi:SixA phosphatase family protein [Granulosicoccus antarcticus]|uniref:2,3-bisphosphoglycerate-dependent phosphoglycerate mutase n=1 Tax=Granulosicoccus antarcticus IMCC3135 TaxID=1192854 RepID=A0A2Z2P1N4_9GAMM|nr:histidine phosphatase family protein [Granulosicoccus antarcticus]ASJ76461.1 2,3-bisphosphoglycerate-dependent phosphoglycerate mutase [Granulosicoccus antarcticus IMCC3135]